MTDYQEQRLNRINHEIKELLSYKSFFKKNLKKMVFIIVLVSVIFPCYGLLRNTTNLNNPELYYQQLVIIGLFIFFGLSFLSVLCYASFWFQAYTSLKPLKQEKHLILDLIEKNKLNFKRFENFDEIGEEDFKL